MIGEGKILKIYIGETDQWQGEPLYEQLIMKFKEKGLAGATAIAGIEGFGLSTKIKSSHIWELSEDLPIIVEVVDKAEKIEAVIPMVEEMVKDGLVTVEEIEIITYKSQEEE
ncbi:DUF190 domain-containing protein [Halanaerobium hydrogeniformans]|uniref:Uncharacterized protein n=1 Tax=Halanaerobium hydrogeniformans TaxID=656519 RepID=E4RM15_HALHG|nr:DUF190 domain-containing protein [Halanaerobium hydrogeniformans]ADQ14098.1 protein of unknown function DUF190 [Halanaerobium hydrogeniformans]